MLNREWLEQFVAWLLGTAPQQQLVPIKVERTQAEQLQAELRARRNAERNNEF
ncbi:hypothetical protein [Saccharophagus degradans]|uniref:hypothetical protein n=1 Tax=Saccharophagus degradans TaxID=86304 RepID=UPI00003C91C2|nr:hypothetical protein [Saccharophagus degradans]